LHHPIVRSVGVVIESSKDKVVLAGDYSVLGDELNRLTRIPTSMVRAMRVLEKKPYLLNQQSRSFRGAVQSARKN